jgi:hypothetical protein
MSKQVEKCIGVTSFRGAALLDGQPLHLRTDSYTSLRNPSLKARWPYWVGAIVLTLAYNRFCFWFALEAWGRRGEPKPDWFLKAAAFATPGMNVPWVGPGLLVALVSLGLVGSFRRFRY